MSKADCPPLCGWASSHYLKACIEQKSWVRENLLPLPDYLWAGTFFSRLLMWSPNTGYVISSPTSHALRLRLKLYRWFSWVFSLPTAVLGTSQSPQWHDPTPYYHIHMYTVHIDITYFYYILLVLFLREP